MFAVAVMMAALKLGGALDADPLFLKTVPADHVAKSLEPEVRRQVVEREVSDPHRPAEEAAPAQVRRPLSGSVASSSVQKIKAPVFYRPSSLDFKESVCGDFRDSPRSRRVVFPLPEHYFNSYDDTWGAARPQGGHEGSDLMSPSGTPEFAITDGTLVRVKRSNENGWNRLGGYTAMLKAAYSVGPIKEGDLFYYAHLEEESILPVGTKVRAGQRIGTVGDTGEGPEVTRDKFPSHLHLGWYDGSGDRSTLESGAMNPYPLLLWLQQNGGAISGGTDVSYCEVPQGLFPQPSTGEHSWPVPDHPGATPDLETDDREDLHPAVEEPREYHPPKRERIAPQVDVPERENEKVGKKREVHEASSKSMLKKRNRQSAGSSARNENGSAGEGDRASRPSGDENSRRKAPRFEAGPSPAAPSRWSHVAIFVDVIDKVRTPKNRYEPDTSDDEQQKKLPGFIKSESPTEKQPVHDRREAPVASEEKREPEVWQPEEHKARS